MLTNVLRCRHVHQGVCSVAVKQNHISSNPAKRAPTSRQCCRCTVAVSWQQPQAVDSCMSPSGRQLHFRLIRLPLLHGRPWRQHEQPPLGSHASRGRVGFLVSGPSSKSVTAIAIVRQEPRGYHQLYSYYYYY